MNELSLLVYKGLLHAGIHVWETVVDRYIKTSPKWNGKQVSVGRIQPSRQKLGECSSPLANAKICYVKKLLCKSQTFREALISFTFTCHISKKRLFQGKPSGSLSVFALATVGSFWLITDKEICCFGVFSQTERFI